MPQKKRMGLLVNKLPLEVAAADTQKRIKLETSSVASSTRSAMRQRKAKKTDAQGHESILETASGFVPSASSSTMDERTRKTPRILLSALLVALQGSQRSDSLTRTEPFHPSSPGWTVLGSGFELGSPFGPAVPVKEVERDEPQANVPDPIDELLQQTVMPSNEVPELLDLLSIRCEEEAANDVVARARRNFEVKDLFAHWPEYHPRNLVTINRPDKIEEIKKRPNRRQLVGQPCRIQKRLLVYHPYAALDDPVLPGSGPNASMSSGANVAGRNTSPCKRNNFTSPRKRRQASIIYADEIDESVLVQLETMDAKKNKIKSWQEAFRLPTELELGWMEDLPGKKHEVLVLEVPRNLRGRSRTWFKAILPTG